jgi:acetyl esterase
MEAPLPMAVEPNTRRFLDGLLKAGGPPIYSLSAADARKVLVKVQRGPIAKPAADLDDRVFPVGPTGQVSVRIVRPKGDISALPALMYFHGGGWILGDCYTHDRLVREIANDANAAVVFVDYVRAPEARYPVAIEQAYAATKYVTEHAKDLNVDVSRLAVAGDSVGGNMATVVAMLAKCRRGPNIGFQIMFYPVTDANFGTASYGMFADGPWLTRDAMKWFWNAYLPDAAGRKESTASPLQASLEQLKGLPPALIITDENDVLRDEGEEYAEKLAIAGVNVTVARYLGTIHDFVLLNEITDTPAPRAAIAQATGILRSFFDS